MEISLVKLEELDLIEEIYADARSFMRENGNSDQWRDGHPSRDMLICDIELEQLFAVRDGGEILGVFAYIEGVDKTYVNIHDGAWKNDLPYSVIHRIAVAKSAHGRGVARFCFDFAFEKYGNLKIDTHRDNVPMQRSLAKSGFEYCGIIYLDNGEERLAYQKTEK